MMIEQPLAHDEIIDHAALQAQLETPICLDECIRSAHHAEQAVRMRACGIINIKLGRVGGFAEAKRVHDVAQDARVPVWCGGMLESGIGRAANIALASLPGFVHPADMSPAAILFEEDLVDPTYQVDREGFIDVPTDAGLGFPVDEALVRARTVRWVELDGQGNVLRRSERSSP